MSELENLIQDDELFEELPRVENDMEADNLVQEIREMEEQKAYWKAYYQQQLKEIEASCDLVINNNTFRLREYFDTLPHKKTATQEKYLLPSGKLVLKNQEPEYEKDEKTVIDFLKANGGEKYIKIKESLDWSALKKTLLIAGETAADENGTPIPGIRVVERDKAFTIEK